MKKIILAAILIVIALPLNLYAVDYWESANSRTIGWDAVTSLSNGNPIPEGDVIEYVIYTANEDKTNIAEMGKTTDTTFVVTLSEEGRKIVGVKTVRKRGEEILSESEVAWSDDPQYVSTAGTFGLKYFISPGEVRNLHP